jgi:hypothetical protein
MTKKHVLIMAGVAVVLATAAVALHARTRSQRLARSSFIDQEHYQRIEAGMQRDEVEAILGGPPGEFITAEVAFFYPEGHSFDWGDGRVVEYWSGDQWEIEVVFDEQGALLTKCIQQASPWPRPGIERLRDLKRCVVHAVSAHCRASKDAS